MLDYKAIIKLRRSGLSLNEIASRLGCKWDSVQRVVVSCENYWGSLDGVPDGMTNEQIADAIFKARKSTDPDHSSRIRSVFWKGSGRDCCAASSGPSTVPRPQKPERRPTA